MTVKELIEKLGEYPPGYKVKFSFTTAHEYFEGSYARIEDWANTCVEIQGAADPKDFI